ncbi:MAG: single-stranded-DNA-specific exonuclease RecJ [Bacillota bacterium]
MTSADIASGSSAPLWRIKGGDAKAVSALAASLRALLEAEGRECVSPRRLKLYKKLQTLDLRILAALLVQRGVTSGEEALAFLFPDISQLHPWQLLPDTDKAVERLQLARQRREKVFIHGDYDADGITATALLVMALENQGIECSYYIPHRQQDGYGLSVRGIDQAAEAGCTLLLTADCGISNAEEVGYAKRLGMDVIITDHHLPPEELPEALAVINPKRQDSDYPFQELAGVGVAWKLVAAFAPDFALSSACLQLVALGTVADLVPLLGENRFLVSLGLQEINANPLPGIAALAEAAGCPAGNMDCQDISYGLGPRLNAGGRMDSAMPAVALLLEKDVYQAAGYAKFLDDLNHRRRQAEEEIFQQALGQAEEQVGQGRRLLVVYGREWHAGVIGIVASKVADRYYRPAIVLCGEEELTGSARSVPGFDIHGALAAVSRHLASYGGHAGAAGLTMSLAALKPFCSDLEEYALAAGIDDVLQPVLELEASLRPEDITMELVDTVSLLRPFGCGNPEPAFAVEGFTAGAISLVGSEKNHLRLRLENAERRSRMWAIGFGKGHLVHNLDPGAPCSVAGYLHVNRWQGKTSLQLQFDDLRGPQRPVYAGREIIDRRGQGEPWLTELARAPGTVFLANTQWKARRMLAGRYRDCHVIILPPDKCREKVYNLKAEDVCFLDPAWSQKQLKECISFLPANCRLHFFGDTNVPEDILRPSLNLLRGFYRLWRDNKSVKDLLSLLPADLAEPMLLERALEIFVAAGLAGRSGEAWQLVPVQGTVDLTQTETWQNYSSQLAAYRNWLRGFSAGRINNLLA